MNKLISHPFELQLNTWFQDFSEQLADLCGGKVDQWVDESLSLLRDTKSQLLERFRQGSSDVATLHDRLNDQAQELLLACRSQVGPTAYPQLNEALSRIESFISGSELSKKTSSLLKAVYAELHDTGVDGRFADIVRSLALWSQGHKKLSGLDLKELLESCVQQAEASSVSQTLSLESLLATCQTSPDRELADNFDCFMGALEQWEETLLIVESSLAEHEKSLLDPVLNELDIFHELLSNSEIDELPWGELKAGLARLRDEWRPMANLLSVRQDQKLEQSEASFIHLESLEYTVVDYQAGTCTLESLQAEVSEHIGRFDQVEASLRTLFSNNEQALKQLDSARLCLYTLASVVSPGDARLGPIFQLYRNSLEGLHSEFDI
jgi:hypothetical protein